MYRFAVIKKKLVWCMSITAHSESAVTYHAIVLFILPSFRPLIVMPWQFTVNTLPYLVLACVFNL